MPLSVKVLAILLVVFASGPARGTQEFDFVPIPAGTAKLGDRQGDANETLRTLQIPAFRLMRREVTNRQFERFVLASGYRTTVERTQKGHVWWARWDLVKGASWLHPQGPQSSLEDLADHPVVQVSAIDAEAYCQYYGLRLPSEEEWEYAARGRQGFRYPWGNTLTPASFAEQTSAGTYSCCAASQADGFLRTAPVGSFPLGRSPFGLDDMAGNVWEWTSSPFPGSPGERVIRGGGWGNNPYCLRAAYRHGNPPDIGLDMVGFRCVAG